MNQNISNKLCLHTIREENEKKTLSSQNISSSVANNKNGMCQNCLVQERRKKNWPDRETLKQLIRFTPFEAIAKQYGFKSGNSPKKWCIAYNLPYRKCDIEKISDEDWELI